MIFGSLIVTYIAIKLFAFAEKGRLQAFMVAFLITVPIMSFLIFIALGCFASVFGLDIDAMSRHDSDVFCGTLLLFSAILATVIMLTIIARANEETRFDPEATKRKIQLTLENIEIGEKLAAKMESQGKDASQLRAELSGHKAEILKVKDEFQKVCINHSGHENQPFDTAGFVTILVIALVVATVFIALGPSY